MTVQPKIAILKWEAGKVPMGLMQLENLIGNSTNEKSYAYPIRSVCIEGANVETIITNPSPVVLQRMIDTAKNLVEREGIKAITTSCGFNAIFQEALAKALPVPVLSSSLLQVPFVRHLLAPEQVIGVITANKSALTQTHLSRCGITPEMKVEVFGLEEAKEWSKIFEKPDECFDMETVEAEILAVAKGAVTACPTMGAIVLECTDLPPYAPKIREAVGLPVFDFISMMNYIEGVL